MFGNRSEATGSVYLHKGERGSTWRCRLYLPTGETRRKIGPAWTGRGRPPEGYFTKRGAEAWLHDHLASIRNGTAPGLIRTGVTFSDACDEWLRHAEDGRRCRPSTNVNWHARKPTACSARSAGSGSSRHKCGRPAGAGLPLRA